MDSARALPSEIESALARGWTILTANQRAARTLHRAFDLQQHAAGLASWQPPEMLAWDSWLAKLWRRLLLEGRASALLLNAAQERTLWRAVVEADDSTRSLRPLDALAQIAAEAWLLLHAYRGHDRLRGYTGNTDAQAFARWAAVFERRCAGGHYLSQAQLAEKLRAAVASGQLAPPPGVLLVGFDSTTPAQTALIDSLRAAGSVVEELAPGCAQPGATARTLVEAPSEREELGACARWLRNTLTVQPDARIAVIVPAIETLRGEIDRVFRHTLAPELQDIAAPAGSGPYEFSLGIPLAHTPLAATALDLLRWSAGPLPLDRVSALLLSPHFAATGATPDAERLARAEFDAFVLRRQPLLRPEISLEELLLVLFSHPSHFLRAPTLRDCLHALRPLVRARGLAGRTHTYAEWSAKFHELLEAAGWAPPSGLDSTEFQARHKWESSLDELATLDFEGARVSFAAALGALERIAAETLFAPESRYAPVQVMGPLESAGSSFDAVWFLRANDFDWPATPAPNPLLPWALQRDLLMPGTDHARDTAYARRITERIAVSAPIVLFSASREREADEGRQRPSAILDLLGLERRTVAEIAPGDLIPAPVPLDSLPDSAAIPLPDGLLHGGAGVLQAQAACAFRAFAQHRLFSSALDSVSLGLDSRERGNLVHHVLERFWAQVETQANLRNMPRSERDALLAQCIEAALGEIYARPAPGWPRAYLDAERQRLLHLLQPWLDYEAQERSSFAVARREHRLDDVPIGPLRLNIRVDRVDTALVDGEPAGEIILDYKTGPAKPSDWLGPRPDAPQLPLYAVLAGTPTLAAVAFASVRRGQNMGINGYQARAGVLPSSSAKNTINLAAQVEEWRGTLEALAVEFHAGDASVSPKQYPQTCEHCDQRLLCRLDPSKLDADVLEELEADTYANPETSDADGDAEANHG